MLQNSTGSCKPRTENPSVVTLRDQTSNGELLQRLEQQNPRMKPLLPETYEVPASDEAFPTQSLQYLSWILAMALLSSYMFLPPSNKSIN